MLGLIPVQENPWLVDYMWRSYCDTLQPFLLLAGPLSGGEADALFRQYWQDLPWRRATFHCENPGLPLALALGFSALHNAAALQGQQDRISMGVMGICSASCVISQTPHWKGWVICLAEDKICAI